MSLKLKKTEKISNKLQQTFKEDSLRKLKETHRKKSCPIQPTIMAKNNSFNQKRSNSVRIVPPPKIREDSKMDKDLTFEKSLKMEPKKQDELNCSAVHLEEKSTFVTNRKDYRGVQIIKGKKKHKVSFLDELKDIEIFHTVLIESFKAYNVVVIEKEEKDTAHCKCIIY